MEAAVQALIAAINGLRGDIQAAAKDTRALVVEQQRTTRELIALVRDLHDELEHRRIARDRGDRLEARLSALEAASP